MTLITIAGQPIETLETACPWPGMVTSVCQLSNSALSESECLEPSALGNLTSAKRKRMFLAGRRAAHTALRRLRPSESPLPILRGDSGEPVWPDGFLGSIAHSESLAAAAVLECREPVVGIGLDLEPATRRSRHSIRERICLSDE
ncbi:MAG: hypothetical protein KDD44_04655, partial [Bdellovibrionales bacterium]|nr:hypothetical protein [Bdellovibrionales bacterium]